MKYLGIWSPKGGVGKSALSICIATYLRKMGKNVLLVDLDSQATCLNWYEERKKIKNELKKKKGLEDKARKILIPETRAGNDISSYETDGEIIIVDFPAEKDSRRVSKNLKALEELDGELIVPISPSDLDLAEIDTVLDILHMQGNSLIPVIVLNKVDRRNRLSEKARRIIHKEYEKELRNVEIILASTEIPYSISFQDTFFRGLVPWERPEHNERYKRIKEIFGKLLKELEVI